MQPWKTLNAEINNNISQMNHTCTVLHMCSKATSTVELVWSCAINPAQLVLDGISMYNSAMCAQ